eukprot:scaffold19389_cov112-Isochrysis_galbana.AAC.2
MPATGARGIGQMAKGCVAGGPGWRGRDHAPRLVEQGSDHVGEGLHTHVSLLAQPVHVGPEPELLLERLHVGGEAGEADEGLVANLEDLLHLAPHCLVPNAVPLVAGDGDAVLAGHRDDGRAVVLHDARHGGPTARRRA